MYFLLDLCCKVSRADALPQAPCTASVSPTDAKVAPAVQQHHRATPSVLDPTPVSLGSTSSGSIGPSSSQLSNAAASAGDPSPQKEQAGLRSEPAAAGNVHAGSEHPSMTPEAAVLGAMAAAAAAGTAAAAAAAPPGKTAAATGAAAEAEAAAAAAANPLDKVQAAMSHKPCRACTTAQDMLAAFRTSQFSHSSSSSRGKSSQAASSQPAGSAGSSESTSSSNTGSSSSSTGTTGTGSASTADSSTSTQQTSEQQQQQCEQQQPQKKQPFWFYEDEMPCPPDILELGRATWTLLHSVAAYYPDQPTEQQQHKMRAFVDALGEFYPCEECRGHLVKELQKHPPEVGSADQLSHWACRLHNLVNIRMGKPAFDCSKVLERWRDGPADDEDACAVGH